MGFLTEIGHNLRVIYAAAFLRTTGVGLTGVVLGVYLSRAGLSATQIGFVITAGLAGAALGTLIVSLRADRLGRRLILIGISLLAALGGLGFALTGRFHAILFVAFAGMVNGMGTDRGPAFALEQAVIPQTTSTDHRTAALSWHSLIMDIGHAAGALIAGLPLLLSRSLHIDLLLAYKVTFGLYGALNLLTASLYLLLTPDIEVRVPAASDVDTRRLSPKSRGVVARLAALSGVDSLGGGFLTDALIAYWFFRRFGISEGTLGLLFFAGNLLNSGSYLIAAWLARRIGLLNTMVFTHIPSSLLLMAVPLASSPGWAMAFYLAWEALVEMDVPTRQSYLMAVVEPGERTFASGVTNLARSASRSLTPSVAGYVMQHLALAAPLFLGGSIKITYDLLLYSAFRRLKPPEEKGGSSQAPDQRLPDITSLDGPAGVAEQHLEADGLIKVVERLHTLFESEDS
ncbi:MAG TPA: MFS transporter [Terriglobia bacterium]